MNLQNKKAAMAAVVWVILVIGILLILGLGGLFVFQQPEVQVPTEPLIPKLTPADITTCAEDAALTVTFAGRNAATGATSGGTVAYKVLDKLNNKWSDIAEVANGGTGRFAPFTKFQIMWMNESNSAATIGAIDEQTIACEQVRLNPLSGLYSNGSLTIEVYNKDSNPMSDCNDVGNNQTLGTSDEALLRVKLQTVDNAGFQHGGYLGIDYNSTQYTVVELREKGSSTALPTREKPDIFTSTGGYRTSKWYKVNPIIEVNEYNYDLMLKTTSTAGGDPTVGYNSSIMNFTFLAIAPFKNGDRGGAFELDVEDEINTATYLYAPQVGVCFA